jgi:hypothetical protein
MCLYAIHILPYGKSFDVFTVPASSSCAIHGVFRRNRRSGFPEIGSNAVEQRGHGLASVTILPDGADRVRWINNRRRVRRHRKKYQPSALHSVRIR